MGAWTSSAPLLHQAHISSRTPALARQTRSLISVSSAPSPPTITTQPANQTVTAGQTATFTAAATGPECRPGQQFSDVRLPHAALSCLVKAAIWPVKSLLVRPGG